MPACPRCHQSIAASALTCPRCQMVLKAHGHPGMTLHRATGGEPLCLTCAYHADDSCTFPKRPDAMDCTLYTDCTQPRAIGPQSSRPSLQAWLRQNSGWIALLALLLLSLVWVLLR
jgi:hypothetical protein